MSAIAIVFILAAVAMMVGPLMLMRPSERQLQLTVLRAKALELGLKVQLKSYQNQSFADYVKPWPQDKKKGSLWTGVEWSLVKKKYAHDIHFFNHWDWEGKSEREPTVVTTLKSLIPHLPRGVSRLNVNKLGVGMTWNEQGGVEALLVLAKQLDELMAELSPSIHSEGEG